MIRASFILIFLFKFLLMSFFMLACLFHWRSMVTDSFYIQCVSLTSRCICLRSYIYLAAQLSCILIVPGLPSYVLWQDLKVLLDSFGLTQYIYLGCNLSYNDFYVVLPPSFLPPINVKILLFHVNNLHSYMLQHRRMPSIVQHLYSS